MSHSSGPPSNHAELIDRLKEGDEQAAREFVAHYEPEIRRLVRLRLNGTGLRRLVDSVDIYQSVFAIFFVKLKDSLIAVESPQKLMSLLSTMIRHKIIDYARRPINHPAQIDSDQWNQIDAGEETPSEQAELAELSIMIQQSLSPEEQQLANLRADGKSWKDIGRLTGKEPDAVRKQLARAVERALRALNGDDSNG